MARSIGREPGDEWDMLMEVPERLALVLRAGIAHPGASPRLAEAGHECFLVGGTVRDALLGERAPDADVDLATDARPDVIEQIVRPWADHVWLQGQRFGTVGCEKSGVKMEITTYRGEVYRPESRKPEVTYSDDIETDLSRRDFTVNAMALALGEPRLIDPHGGATDLAARVLRTPLSPEVSFSDDPLRMLRAARFVAAYGLVPVPELVAAIEALRHRLEIVSTERIRDELAPALGPRPERRAVAAVRDGPLR